MAARRWRRTGLLSSQYVRGNENNQHQSGTYTDALGSVRTFEGPGKIGGYAILNLNAEAKLGGGWQVFAKINNVFDRKYATVARWPRAPSVGGSFQADPDDWRRQTFVALVGPRVRLGYVRYVFGGKDMKPGSLAIRARSALDSVCTRVGLVLTGLAASLLLVLGALWLHGTRNAVQFGLRRPHGCRNNG